MHNSWKIREVSLIYPPTFPRLLWHQRMNLLCIRYTRTFAGANNILCFFSRLRSLRSEAISTLLLTKNEIAAPFGLAMTTTTTQYFLRLQNQFDQRADGSDLHDQANAKKRQVTIKWTVWLNVHLYYLTFQTIAPTYSYLLHVNQGSNLLVKRIDDPV